jgi:hypothetical protein
MEAVKTLETAVDSAGTIAGSGVKAVSSLTTSVVDTLGDLGNSVANAAVTVALAALATGAAFWAIRFAVTQVARVF